MTEVNYSSEDIIILSSSEDSFINDSLSSCEDSDTDESEAILTDDSSSIKDEDSSFSDGIDEKNIIDTKRESFRVIPKTVIGSVESIIGCFGPYAKLREPLENALREKKFDLRFKMKKLPFKRKGICDRCNRTRTISHLLKFNKKYYKLGTLCCGDVFLILNVFKRLHSGGNPDKYLQRYEAVSVRRSNMTWNPWYDEDNSN